MAERYASCQRQRASRAWRDTEQALILDRVLPKGFFD